MIKNFTIMVQPELFKEELSLVCFIEITSGKIVKFGIEEKYVLKFRNEFNLKYEMEYGTNQQKLIDDELEKYLKEVTDQIEVEVEKETERIKLLLKDVSSKTIDYLENLSKYKNMKDNEVF